MIKSLALLLISASCIPYPAIGATILTLPPIVSEPCTTVSLPDGGTACVPKLSQRYNAAPRLVQLGDVIRTQYESDAKRLCRGWGGTHLMPRPDEKNAWDCFKRD